MFHNLCEQAYNVPDGWPSDDQETHINYYVHEDFTEKFHHCSPVYDSSDQLHPHYMSGIMKHAAEIWNVSSLSTPLTMWTMKSSGLARRGAEQVVGRAAT